MTIGDVFVRRPAIPTRKQRGKEIRNPAIWSKDAIKKSEVKIQQSHSTHNTHINFPSKWGTEVKVSKRANLVTRIIRHL